MSRPTRSPVLLATLLGVTVALGACGSDDDGDDIDALAPLDDAGAGAGDDAVDPPDALPDTDIGAVDDGVDPDPVTPDPVDPGADDPDTDAPEPDADDPDADPTDASGVDAPADDPLSGTASRFGVVSVVRDDAEESGIVAAFYALGEGLSLDGTGSGPLPDPDEDLCTFDSEGASGVDATTGIVVPELDDPDLTPLSAGENVVVSGPGGTFATLQRTEAAGFVVYAPEGGSVAGPIPSGLVVDVPGDEFPAFAAVRVPDASPLTGVTPAGPEGVTAGTTFGWDAGTDPSTRVTATLAIEDTDPVVSLTCSLVDDGEFRLPASLLARIPADRPATASLARVGTRALQDGDAVLLVTATAGRE